MRAPSVATRIRPPYHASPVPPLDSFGGRAVADYSNIQYSVDDRGVATIALDRPEAKNAMSNDLMAEVRDAATVVAQDDAIRVLILTGTGDIFSAGGDLKGMKTQATRTRAERIADATAFAETLAYLDQLPTPIVGRINGSAFGGGLGLISICDTAIGLNDASFRLTEVTLGLIPATISPYVIARVGVPNARRLMMNARNMRGPDAVRFGLLTESVDADQLDAAVEKEVARFLKCAPGAVARCKRLIEYVATHTHEENIAYTAERLADAWESDELAQGIAAFLTREKPPWHTAD